MSSVSWVGFAAGSSPFGVSLSTASGKSFVILAISSSRDRPVCIERAVRVSSSNAVSTSFGSIGSIVRH